jgi:hypothetical protein
MHSFHVWGYVSSVIPRRFLTTGLLLKAHGRVILRPCSLDHLHGNSLPYCLSFIVFQRRPDHLFDEVFAAGRISAIHTGRSLVFAVLATEFAAASFPSRMTVFPISHCPPFVHAHVATTKEAPDVRFITTHLYNQGVACT